MRTFYVPSNIGKLSVNAPAEGFSLPETLKMVEKSAIEDALDDTDGNQTQAAKLLGIKRTALVEKMRRYSLGNLPPRTGKAKGAAR